MGNYPSAPRNGNMDSNRSGQTFGQTPKPPENHAYNFPVHWGKPPSVQTKDIRDLPGKYGTGSTTLYKWIERNMERDKEKKNEIIVVNQERPFSSSTPSSQTRPLVQMNSSKIDRTAWPFKRENEMYTSRREFKADVRRRVEKLRTFIEGLKTFQKKYAAMNNQEMQQFFNELGEGKHDSAISLYRSMFPFQNRRGESFLSDDDVMKRIMLMVAPFIAKINADNSTRLMNDIAILKAYRTRLSKAGEMVREANPEVYITVKADKEGPGNFHEKDGFRGNFFGVDASVFKQGILEKGQKLINATNPEAAPMIVDHVAYRGDNRAAYVYITNTVQVKLNVGDKLRATGGDSNSNSIPPPISIDTTVPKFLTTYYTNRFKDYMNLVIYERQFGNLNYVS